MDWKERNLKLAWDWWKEYGKPDDDLVNIPEALIAFGEFYNAELTAEIAEARQQIEQRDALLNATRAFEIPTKGFDERYFTKIHKYDGYKPEFIGKWAHGIEDYQWDSPLDAYNALTSSGLDVPDHKG